MGLTGLMRSLLWQKPQNDRWEEVRAGGLQDLWAVVKTLAFALNEMGGMESSEQIKDVI